MAGRRGTAILPYLRAPGSVKRLLGAAATRTLDLLAPRYRDRLLSPRAQRLRVVEEVGGHLVILHDLPMLSVRSDWAHVARLEVGASGVIHLQVERVIGDQGEKAIARVDADTAEHAAGADTWDHAAQLVGDEGSEARADWHWTSPACVWRAPGGSHLSCGRTARRRKVVGRSPCPVRGTTLRFPQSDHRPPASSAC